MREMRSTNTKTHSRKTRGEMEEMARVMTESPNAMGSSIIIHLVGRIIGHCHTMMESTRPKE